MGKFVITLPLALEHNEGEINASNLICCPWLLFNWRNVSKDEKVKKFRFRNKGWMVFSVRH